MAVLTLNAGSSSLKFSLFEADRPLLRGAFESITETPTAFAKDAAGGDLDPPKANGTGHEAVLPALFAWIASHPSGHTLDAIGHRIVHGGNRAAAARIDAGLLEELAALTPLAPLHQPHCLAAIRAARNVAPDLPQVACFDTAFHHTLPELARRLPLPERFGLRRYGFHGLSYDWIASTLPPELHAGRVIVAHLGSGASLCALHAGKSVETTMGCTPLDGLIMATRCGSLDPGAVLYLLQERGLSADEVSDLLYHHAGLAALAGEGDIRRLHASGTPEAAAAIALFCYRVAQCAGSLLPALGGLDGLIFTGGIGEHDADVRRTICESLAWLGLSIDPAARAPGRISPPGAAVQVWVIATDEEAVIARQTGLALR